MLELGTQGGAPFPEGEGGGGGRAVGWTKPWGREGGLEVGGRGGAWDGFTTPPRLGPRLTGEGLGDMLGEEFKLDEEEDKVAA